VNRAKSERPALETQAILRHWLEAVPNDRLAHLVRDAARGLGRSLQARLAAHGVAFGHWIFLRILWERQGLTQRELSLEAGVMEPTTSAALDTLAKAGYVRRRKKAGNRKNVHVFLTGKGAALKDRLVPLAEAVNAVAVRGIAPTHIAVTRRTLLALIRNLAEDEARIVAAPARRRAAPRRNVTRPLKR
jgi:DNA-binding MarR family transcriptional regulator